MKQAVLDSTIAGRLEPHVQAKGEATVRIKRVGECWTANRKAILFINKKEVKRRMVDLDAFQDARGRRPGENGLLSLFFLPAGASAKQRCCTLCPDTAVNSCCSRKRQLLIDGKTAVFLCHTIDDQQVDVLRGTVHRRGSAFCQHARNEPFKVVIQSAFPFPSLSVSGRNQRTDIVAAPDKSRHPTLKASAADCLSNR